MVCYSTGTKQYWEPVMTDHHQNTRKNYHEILIKVTKVIISRKYTGICLFEHKGPNVLAIEAPFTNMD